MLSKYWWVLLVRGLIGVLFGIAAFAMPQLTLVSLVLVFGVYAFVDGIVAIVVGFRQHDGKSWLIILEGIFGMIIGVMAWLWPGIAALAFIYWIASWALITGVLAISAAMRPHIHQNEWSHVLAGVISILFGLLIFVNPGPGGVAVIWIFGAYAIAFGIALIILSFRVRHRGGVLRHAVI